MESTIPQIHTDIEIQSISITELTELTHDQSHPPIPRHERRNGTVQMCRQLQMPGYSSSSAPSCSSAKLFVHPTLLDTLDQLHLQELLIDLFVFFAINPAGRLIINVKIHCSISGGSVCCHTCLTALSVTPGRAWLWFVFLTQIQPQEKRTPTIQKPNKTHRASFRTGFRVGSANVKTSSTGTVFIYSLLSSSKAKRA